MVPPKYKFYIINESHGTTRHEINPHYKELNKKYAKESGQEFFRITLDGKITLFGDDYEIINNASIEDNLLFVIDKLNRTTNTWTEYYKGEFNKTDCKLDYEKKSCELKTSPLDQYTQVMNKYDNTYDLIKLAPAISKINLHKRALMQVYVRGTNSISNFLGGTYWEDDVNEVIDSHADLIEKYYFSYVKAGNEFYVSGAGISDVNGVYAGTNGNWQKWYGYRGQLTKVTSKGDPAPISNMPKVYSIYAKADRTAAYDEPTETYAEDLYKFQIVRTSDSKVLYESEWTFYTSTEDIYADNMYIGRDDIKMINKSNSSDVFTLTNVFVYHVYQRLLCDVDTVEDSEGVKETYDIPADDFVFDNRNYKKCIGLRGGLFFCTSRASTEPTKYGMNDYGEYFTSDFIAATMGVGRPLPISRNFWANASLWYVYDYWYEYFEERSRKQYTLKDSYSVGAVIKALLKKIDPSLTHEETAEYSRFLYGYNNAISIIDGYYVNYQNGGILPLSWLKYIEMRVSYGMKIKYDYINSVLDARGLAFYDLNGNFISGIQALETSQTIEVPEGAVLCKATVSNENEVFLYDTSVPSSMDRFYPHITPKTNILKGDYDQAAQKAEITFEELMNMLRDCFRCYWYIEEGKFKVEHIYYFMNGGSYSAQTNYQLDFTKLKDQFNKKLSSYFQSSIEFDKSELNSRYEFNWMDDVTDLMGNVTLDINANYVQKDKTEEVNVSQFTSDIDLMLLDPSSFSEDGFALLCPIKSGSIMQLPISSVTLQDENGDTYDALVQNWYASWSYLVRLYQYDLPAYYATCNTLGELYSNDIKKSMKHTIEFHTEDDPNELQLIKTTIGNGKIDSISINLDTRLAKANLMYRPK